MSARAFSADFCLWSAGTFTAALALLSVAAHISLWFFPSAGWLRPNETFLIYVALLGVPAGGFALGFGAIPPRRPFIEAIGGIAILANIVAWGYIIILFCVNLLAWH